MTRELGRVLIVLGGVLLVAGVALTFFGGLGLGRLPGDFYVRRGTFTFYFPLATSIILSILLTLILAFFQR